MTRRAPDFSFAHTSTRRQFLRQCGGFGVGLATFGFLGGRGYGQDKGQVIVRSPGGAYEDGLRKAYFEPFTAETGIQVVPIATTAAKVVAAVEAGTVDIDVLDIGEQQCLQLYEKGAVEVLDRSKFHRTNLADIDQETIGEAWIGNINFSTVMGYNTEHFRDRHPTSWAEFWDVDTFPGPRTLEDLAAGVVNLEFALLADGVPKEQIYPIDMDRAFKKLKEIKKHIVKWWDTGAISAQLFTDKEVVAGSIWNGRIQIPIDAGAPLAIEWNEAMLQQQVYGIVKGAPNRENAYKYIDFALQAKQQAIFAEFIPYGPSNEKAYALLSDEVKAKLPGAPEHKAKAFRQNVRWWIDHRNEVAERWQEFLIGG